MTDPYQRCPHGSLWPRDCHECKVEADLRKRVASADFSKLEERVLAMGPIPTLPGAPPPPTTGRTGLENRQAAIPQIQGAGEKLPAAPPAPTSTPCNDPACPCQDGYTCHYVDGSDGTTALAAPTSTPAVMAAAPEYCDGFAAAYKKATNEVLPYMHAPPAPSAEPTDAQILAEYTDAQAVDQTPEQFALRFARAVLALRPQSK